MKSYLEVSWIVCSVLLYAGWIFAGVLNHYQLSSKKCAFVSLVLGLLNVLCFKGAYVLFGVSCFIGSLILAGFRLILWIQSLLWYAVITNALGGLDDLCLSGSLLYVDASSDVWIVIVVMILMICCVAEKCFGPVFWRSELYIPVVLSVQNQRFDCIGFYDTGNRCTFAGKPVVFVNHPFESVEEVIVCGIDGQKRMKAALGTAKIQKKKYSVMIAYAQDLQVECLLHSTMR